MNDSTKPDGQPVDQAEVQAWLRARLAAHIRSSAREMLESLEGELGIHASWHLHAAFEFLAEEIGDTALSREARAYLASLLEDGSLDDALRGGVAPNTAVQSSIDSLLRQSAFYRSSAAFREMIDFCAKFRSYAPYNNMLVRLQNRSCGFYARAEDWAERFGRHLKEDARPMLILAPMHPVLLVYDLDQTEGPPLPSRLEEFGKFQGPFKEEWLKRLIANAERHRIQVQFKFLSQTHGGFATTRARSPWKMRIAIHDGLDPPSRFGLLCHEMAHILLGHLGGDQDGWWPARAGLTHQTVEIEAEAVAHIVATRFGLSGSSASYLASHVRDAAIPASVSSDSIAKVAAKLERMANESVPVPKKRASPSAKTGSGKQ
jgi:hypothetical protein